MPDHLPLTPARRLLKPFLRFASYEASSGLLLLACATVALIWANSPWAAHYFEIWHTPLVIELGEWRLAETLAHWINDGLMVIFFLLVGLEIKREFLGGELAGPRKAALPIAAAAGGMIVPALIYLGFNATGPGQRGWGVPMATDIAFALGVLALAGRRAPLGLKVFLAAVAIVDDLGAVLVIAFFYSEQLKIYALITAGALMAVLVVLNLLHARPTWVYMVVGLLLWLAVYKSGIHATVAGVLLALAIPDRRRIDEAGFYAFCRRQLSRLERDAENDETPYELSEKQQDVVESLEAACEAVQTPLRRLEHKLVPWVAYLIMPLFALANAGVSLLTQPADLGRLLFDPIKLGIAVGLVVGKPIGVFGFAWLAVKLGLATLPSSVNWRTLTGACLLCGIGFTMALFIAELAFEGSELLDAAKLGVLAGSLVAGVAGLLWVFGPGSRPARSPAAPAHERAA